MTIYDICKEKLEKFPDFRERRFRGERLARLALRELGLEELHDSGRQLPLKDMVEFANKYDSYRHEYDAVQRDCPNLRGTDYPDKTKLVQQKQIEFGYYPGFNQDIKKLTQL